MLKIFSIISLIVFNSNVNYVQIESIECYSNIGEKIEFNFKFNSDYSSSHQIVVIVDLFNDNGKYLGNYKNTLKIVGEKEAVARIDYLYGENMYAMVDVLYDDNELVSNAKFEFFDINKCYLNEITKECIEPYKSIYSKGIVRKKESDFKVLNAPFNDFLEYNKLDLSKFIIYSDYDFSSDQTYIVVKEKISEYDFYYSDEYIFPLNIEKNEYKYNFSLLEEYYINFNPFVFSENMGEGGALVNELYFPFIQEYKEYHCSIVIIGQLHIEIDFVISTSDGLFGECANSKFCLEGILL